MSEEDAHKPTDLPSIAAFKPLLNDAATSPFVEAVGKLMQNFGFIELLAVRWVSALATDPVLIEESKRMSLVKRIQLVRRLVSDARFPLPKEDARVIGKLWLEVEKLASLRNDVAHNPVSIAFEEGPGSRPVVEGILNLRPRQRGSDYEVITLTEIDGGIGRSGAIAKQLDDALGAVEGAEQPPAG